MSILHHFNRLILSADQEAALRKLDSFISGRSQVFMLMGYAGSGKTTILKGLVEYLNAKEKQFDLLAPTGRAAKVICEKTGQQAYTIHKGIYSYETLVEKQEGESFKYYYEIRNNADVAGKLFIVDEASMISDAKSEGEFFSFGTGYLLTDLITYTRVTIPGVNSKIIFVGDPCQLPPVGDNSSKAFDAEYLQTKFNLSTEQAEMKEVKRQSGDSGILQSAARIRKSLSSGFFNDFDLRSNGMDIVDPGYETFLEAWQSIQAPKIIVAYKNKTCLDLNLQIRALKYGDGSLPIQKGDIVIMGGNNYRKGIFNGEFAVVNEVDDMPTIREVHLKGQPSVTLKWRSVQLIFPDNDNSNKTVQGQILENFLYGDNTLKPEEKQALYVDFKQRNPELKLHTSEFKEAIINDDYFNCLMIKYGYAVTCHKAQGGEWDNVFVVWDHDNRQNFDFVKEQQTRKRKTNADFYRWAYTAVTRASKQLFVINPPYFNSYTTLAILNIDAEDALKQLAGRVAHTEEDIMLDDELLSELKKNGLADEPIQLQDHFIKILFLAQKNGCQLTGVQKNGFEIWYRFRSGDHTIGLKTWFNKDYVFNGKYQMLPALTNAKELYDPLVQAFQSIVSLSVKRNTSETVLAGIEFEYELEEKFPFTHVLYDDLKLLLSPLRIAIDDLQHQQYKERYIFKRDRETAVVDFEYNADGFWGRVVPISRGTNSPALSTEILNELKAFKQENYVGE